VPAHRPQGGPTHGKLAPIHALQDLFLAQAPSFKAAGICPRSLFRNCQPAELYEKVRGAETRLADGIGAASGWQYAQILI